MKKEIVLTVVFGFLVFSLIGCKDEELSFVIDEKFRGKWETQTIVSKQGTYNFPVMLDGKQVNSRGWLIEERTIKVYHNGAVVATFTDLYSDLYADGSARFLQIADDAHSSIEMEATGSTAKISLTNVSDNCKKVSKFSWE